MKKILLWALVFLGVFFFLSCSDELIPDLREDEQVLVRKCDSITVAVFLEQNTTKTLLSDTDVLWGEGDQIKIFNAATPAGEVFTLVGPGGEKSGTFSGPVLEGDGPFYAVYPADAAVSLSESVVNLSVPGTQVYKTAGDTFGAGANLSAGTADALAEGFTFKNVFGVLRLTIRGSSAVKSIALYSKAESDVLYGTFSLSFSGGIPVAAPASGQTTGDCRKLLLDCDMDGAGISLSDTGNDFYMVVPAGALDAGMTLEVFDQDGNAMVMNAGASSDFMVRSNIRPMPAFDYTSQYKAAFLTSEALAGAFSSVLTSGDFTVGCIYSEESGQYAYRNMPGDDGSRYFRIQDWSSGFALGLTTPYGLNAGKKVMVTVESLGQTGVTSAEDVSMRILKIEGNRVWLCDPATGCGYIMMLMED